jgi:hypothetical protein
MQHLFHKFIRRVSVQKTQGAPTIAYFYEIRSADNTVLKRDGGFPNQDAAKEAARADAKKMKLSHHLGVPSVGKILVGQNAEQATR